MDSLSQLALGAAVGIAVMGRRTALWKAALWGGVCGTLPDLDAFIDHGDAVRNMVLHRAETHALFYLTLAAPVIAAGIAWLHRDRAQLRRWWLAVWLALVTHPLLDWTTVYGTQLWRPFSSEPLGLGSMFIIDPLYTLPLLVGVGVALRTAAGPALRWNAAGLLLSSLYLGWSAWAQHHVTGIATAALAAQGVQVQKLLVTPTPFNTVAWRIVAITPQGFSEGFYALSDANRAVVFEHFPRGEALEPALRDNPGAQRIAAFSHGFYRLSETGGRLFITDLRMGQEPFYTFRFAVAERGRDGVNAITPVSAGTRPPLEPALRWLGQRVQGQPLPPPR